MANRYHRQKELADAPREHTVSILRGMSPVTFYLPHRRIDNEAYFNRHSLIRLFTPLADAYAGSKIDEYRRKLGYQALPMESFNLADVLACRRRGEGPPYDLNVALEQASQSLKELAVCKSLRLNFFIHDFGGGYVSSRSVSPFISPLFNEAVAQSWTGPSPEAFVAAFRQMAQKNHADHDDLTIGNDVYVHENVMRGQIKPGLKMLARINHALHRPNKAISDADHTFWGYIQTAIAPR